MKNRNKAIPSDSQVRKLLSATRKLIRDCSLENGAIVAADTTKLLYPKAAKNYYYVWPRDAAFACIASDMLGLRHVAENFFHWCVTRAEGFEQTGVFYEKYYPNGLKALPNFQPDQTGAVLFALWHHRQAHPESSLAEWMKSLTAMAADGICRAWKETHFIQITHDIWEERHCFPDLEENFSYSLAACIKGLRCAHQLLPNRPWLDTAEKMKCRLDQHFMEHFIRSFGKIPDRRIDASIMGLVYPFDVYTASDPRMIASIREIETKLCINGGIHRYEQDDYDGWMHETLHRKKGAGAWPLLNFWLSIYYAMKGDITAAEKYYYWVMDRLPNGDQIPEQLFDNDFQVSVSPLLWSHTMFVLATSHLQALRGSGDRMYTSFFPPA